MSCDCFVVKDGSKPCHFYIKLNNKEVSFDLFRKGSGLSLKTALERSDKAKELIKWASCDGFRTNNYLDLQESFDLKLFNSCDLIRDYGLNSIKTSGSENGDRAICSKMSAILDKIGTHPYQTLLSGAQQLYNDISESGIFINYTKVNPKWTFDTFSGRSKCTNFNLQGWTNEDFVYRPNVPFDNILIHFDWICADIRVASIMSGDESLMNSFKDSDPYTYLSNKINGNSSMRNEAKLLLLKTINSLDYSNEYISRYFPSLSEWLRLISIDTHRKGFSTNMLGRKFFVSDDRNDKSILNAVMQGSVASGMQNVLINVHKMFPDYIITDIHDSLVLSVPNDKKIVKLIIDEVGKIFLNPFQGLFQDNHSFPYRISVGNKWKNWKKFLEIRL
jgi:hypothetical protein